MIFTSPSSKYDLSVCDQPLTISFSLASLKESSNSPALLYSGINWFLGRSKAACPAEVIVSTDLFQKMGTPRAGSKTLPNGVCATVKPFFASCSRKSSVRRYGIKKQPIDLLGKDFFFNYRKRLPIPGASILKYNEYFGGALVGFL